MCKVRHFALAILLASPVFAQTPVPADLLQDLIANAEQFRATLPSVTADEIIQSEASSFRSTFKERKEVRGTLRVFRSEPGEPLREVRHIDTINGKPLNPAKKTSPAWAVSGGFGGFQDMFFAPAQFPCYTFTLRSAKPASTIQIAIFARNNLKDIPGCDPRLAGLTGLLRIDPATHQIVHLERTIPDEQTDRTNIASFASVDLAPTTVGDQTFWLPSLVAGRSPRGPVRSESVARYTNYHRYTASVTVLSGTTAVVESPSTPR